MKAHMSRDKARAETPEQLRHWILTIAKSSYLTAVASNFAAKRDIRKERAECGAEPFANTPEPIDIVATEHNLQLVKRYLYRLSPDSQRAVELRYLEQLGYSEIADRMGKTENAIRLLVSRGLRALKKMKHRL
jgi:RNA polymerase sigma factor (sigma-70 family)